MKEFLFMEFCNGEPSEGVLRQFDRNQYFRS